MKKQSHFVQLQQEYSVEPYTKLFVDEYNKVYFNSFAVSQPYRENPESKVRDLDANQIILFYEENKASIEVLDEQVARIKGKIALTMKTILNDAKISLVKEQEGNETL
jgi:hypothetical protein